MKYNNSELFSLNYHLKMNEYFQYDLFVSPVYKISVAQECVNSSNSNDIIRVIIECF